MANMQSKQKNLWILCGPPGCGKTTWVMRQLEAGTADLVHVSRDAIRFSLLEESDSYFAKENEVFNEFINQIQKALDENGNVFIDATHLTQKSRNKTLDRLKINDVNIIPVSFEISLDTCQAQNAKRIGRSYVPIGVIEKMYNSYVIPTNNEKYKYYKIIHIKEK